MNQDWNELTLTENPAVDLLQELGYHYLEADELETFREGPRSSVLRGVLAASLERLNPWLSEENLNKAVRVVTMLGASSLAEANEKAYTVITKGVSLSQDLGSGNKNQTVRFIDYETSANNQYHVARQVRVQGSRVEAVFDAVVYVNGLPLAIIECKSPLIDNPLKDAVEQLMRYQEAESHFRQRGVPQAFETTQLVLALARDTARYATTGAVARHFYPFPEVYPKPELPLEELTARPVTVQDTLLYSVLEPKNLLEFVQNLILFEAEYGSVTKKIARYQQRIAIQEAVGRLTRKDVSSDRGGVIWHTQGSGKSLTMVWLAQKLRREALGFDNPTIVIVTDRTELDAQISGTFHRVGFPSPQQAKGVTHLRELLQKGNGLTILTTVHKFFDATQSQALNEARNLFVMIDEAHRSQYSKLAARMRAALPNATFFAFTGTPIDNDQRSTFKEFGPYVHKYTLERSVEDGATLDIFYEGRELERFAIEGRDLDKLEGRVLSGLSDDEKRQVTRKVAGWESVLAAAPARLRTIALDLVEHYDKFIKPNGFKAQLVVSSRRAAVRYKAALDKIPGAPESAVIMTALPNDDAELAKYHRSKSERQKLIARFKNPKDSLSLLIVVDMLITGFDAPVEQVMYLDRGLKAHTLLQAIARVNRPAEGKDYGLIVDYWGVSEHLQEALASFDREELGTPMRPKDAELDALRARHSRVMDVFKGLDPNNYDALLKRLEDDDQRADFDGRFRAFAESLNLFYPDPRALEYRDDFAWLGQIRRAARNRFYDTKLGDENLARKVRQIIDEHVTASGVVTLTETVSILSPAFATHLEGLGSDDARASEMAHALTHQLSEKASENPVFYVSLREQLNEIIEARRAERLSAAEQLKRLYSVREALQNGAQSEAKRLGLTDTAFAFYKLVTGEGVTLDEGEVESLASDLEERVAAHLVLDWTEKDDVLRLMRRDVRRALLRHGVSREHSEVLIPKLLSTAKARLAHV